MPIRNSSTAAASWLAALIVLAGGLSLLGTMDMRPDVVSLPLPWRPLVLTAAATGAAALLLRQLRRGPSPRTDPAVAEEPSLLPLDGWQAGIDALVEGVGGPPAPQLCQLILEQAIAHEASDVHLVPYESHTEIRLRVDGAMARVAQLPSAALGRITSRLKVLCRLPPYVHQRFQDGRFTVDFGPRRVDVRAAFMPTLHGERIVLRVLERAEVERGLASLGATETQQRVLETALHRPQGLLIFTGPSGCGKTTSMYCALRAIVDHSRQTRSVCTLEDPVEYDLATINQTSLGDSSDLTFASALRTMLRQDPDVIMVGEIRDLETARVAVQAGLTGHLIITSVHAKHASATFLRLIELGIDARSVASSVTLVVAQRLLRRLCPQCRVESRPTPSQRALLGEVVGDHIYYEPTGCRRCGMKGYAGRLGVFEVLETDERLRGLVASGAAPEAIQRHAAENGATTLLESSLQCARRGETSLSEVLRASPVLETSG